MLNIKGLWKYDELEEDFFTTKKMLDKLLPENESLMIEIGRCRKELQEWIQACHKNATVRAEQEKELEGYRGMKSRYERLLIEYKTTVAALKKQNEELTTEIESLESKLNKRVEYTWDSTRCQWLPKTGTLEQLRRRVPFPLVAYVEGQEGEKNNGHT